MSREFKVIGVGSPFGDDDIGWRVAEIARAHLPAGVEVVSCDRPGAALLEQLSDVKAAVIVDAMLSDGPVGHVRCMGVAGVARASGLLSSHGFDLRQALALGEALGQLPPRLTVIGIGIGADLALLTTTQRQAAVAAGVAAVQAWHASATASRL